MRCSPIGAALVAACFCLGSWAARAAAKEISTAEGCRILVAEAAAGPTEGHAWSGACVDGYADGPGTLTRTFDAEGKPRESRGHGQMSRGRRIGAWIVFTGAPGRPMAVRVQALDASGRSVRPVAGPFTVDRLPDARAAIEQAHAAIGSAPTQPKASQLAEVDLWAAGPTAAVKPERPVQRQANAATPAGSVDSSAPSMKLPPPSSDREEPPQPSSAVMEAISRCTKDPEFKKQPAFADPYCRQKPPPHRTRLTHQQCNERAVAIHQRWQAENDRAASTGARNAAEQRAQTAIKALFQGECAHDVEARGMVAKADASLRRLGGGVNSSSTSTVAAGNVHDPAAMAHACVRPNYGQAYGGFTNACGFAISFIHCIYRPTKFTGDSEFFNCERAGGLWSDRTTAGNLRAGATDSTSLPPGGRPYWFACREPYSIRNVQFDGNTLRGACVRS